MKRALATLLLFAAACNDEPPDPSAHLRRPSGLVYVERPRAPKAGGVVTARDDLFVADAEAEGVLVEQLRKTVSDVTDPMTGVVSAQTDYSNGFLQSAAIYFPLVIAAAGFPEEIAATLEPEHAGLYVLSAGGAKPVTGRDADAVGLLHILDIGEVDYGARVAASAGKNVPLGVVLLEDVVPAAIPVDVEVVASTTNVQDLLIVAFDPIAGGPGRVAIFTVQRRTPDAQGIAAISGVVTATIPAAPRSILAAGDGLFLISSAATSSVTEVQVDVTGQRFASLRSLSAGGPTAGFVSVPRYGALALRIDRASAAAFELSAGRFTRSTAWFDSPFTPIAERRLTAKPSGQPAIGRIDFRGSPVSAGAGGRVETLMFSGSGVDLVEPTDRGTDDGLATVVLLAHLDGRASFLVGTPPRVAALSQSRITDALTIAGGGATLLECDDPPTDVVKIDADLPSCPRFVSPQNVEASRYRISYRGALANGFSTLTLAPMVGEVFATITDAAVADFTARKVQVGDAVDVELRDELVKRSKCEIPPATPIDIIDRGVVTEVRADAVVVRFQGPLASYSPCEPGVVARYEIYPVGEEVVLSKLAGETVAEVQDRVAATATRAFVRGDFEATLQVDSAFTCAVDTKPRWCAADVECGAGRLCTSAASGNSLPNTCAELCTAGIAGCVALPQARRCSGVELGIAGSDALAIDLRNISQNNAVSYATAPAAAVFSPLFSSWYISYPGFRVLARVQAGSTGLTQNYDR